MLSTRLRDLVQAGVLDLAPASDGSAYQEYVLTEKGRNLFLGIVTLRQWGEEHLYREGERRSVLVDAATNTPVSRLTLHASDGRRLDWADTRIETEASRPKSS